MPRPLGVDHLLISLQILALDSNLSLLGIIKINIQLLHLILCFGRTNLDGMFRKKI